VSKADDLKRFLQECDVDDPMVIETPTGDVELQVEHVILALRQDGTWDLTDFS